VIAGLRPGSRQRGWLVLCALVAATVLLLSATLVPQIELWPRLALAAGAGLVPAAVLPLIGRDRGYARLVNWGAAIAFLGGAIALIGVAWSGAFSEEMRTTARPGEQVTIGPWLVQVAAIDPVAGPDFTAIEARLRATRGAGVDVLRPQARTSVSSDHQSNASATSTSWTGRLTATLGQARGDGHELRLSWTPLVTLIWLGGALIGLGGLVTLAGLRWRLAAFTTAALLLAGAAYAFFGGSTPDSAVGRSPLPASLVTERNAFLGQFNGANHWLILADGFAGRGNTQDAAAILQSAVRAHPRNYALWLGLGNALTDHARRLTPAAQLAFARSAQFSPTSPAPGYFLGRAKLRSGDREGALAEWRKILADAPANAGWRPIVEDSIAMADSAPRR